ncbi:trypsin-like serine protease, partial [Ramicandelaber brevisporus]
INVDTVYIHPSYDPDEMANDIGLLHLSKPLKLNDKTIAAAKIDSRRISDTTAFEVAGWGLTSNGGEVSDKLLRVQIKANDQKSCTAVRPTYKDQNGDVICTGKTPGRDSCQGDSGGPL